MQRLMMIACLAALALPAGAETAQPLRLAALSADLYARGLAEGDALVIIAAARLRKEANLSPVADGPDSAPDIAPDIAPTWEAMLDRAETLAAGDEALIALIEDTRADLPKGVTAGPVYSIAALPAATSAEVAELAFRGGEYAEVYVEAAPGTDLNLTVRDGAGNLVCADTDKSHVAYCGWTPAADGVFLLTIENRGAMPAEYALMTN